VTGQAADLIILEPSRVPVPVAELGEGPCWDQATSTLYWVDIPAGLVHRLTADGEHSCWEVGQQVGAVVPRAGGGLVLAAGTGFFSLDTDTGIVELLATAEPDHEGKPGNQGKPGEHGELAIRMNDGACDSAGRFFAGTMAHDESPGKGALYRLDPDHSVTTLITGVGLSNGIGWSPDERLMYYIDSLTYRVDVFDYDPVTGAIGDRRPFASLGSEDVVPDGLAVDSSGGVWVAVWGGGVIQRYSAEGTLTGVVRLPAAHVTSCAFAGPGLDQLYITTAAGPGSSGGALFTCPAGFTGRPTYSYQG
jgi:sugar lactone lactonase YvrE